MKNNDSPENWKRLISLAGQASRKNLLHTPGLKAVPTAFGFLPGEDALSCANRLWAAGDNASALPHYVKAIQENPQNWSAWNGKGNVLDNLGRREEALAAYECAIQLAPDEDYPWNGKGNVLDNLGRREEALAAYEHAIQLAPKGAIPWNGKGNALENLGRHAEALQAYEHAIQLAPNNANPWNGKGNALDNLGSHAEALAAYERGIQLAPNSSDLWNGKGNALDNLGWHAEALAAYERAIQLDPNNANPWNGKGNALLSLDELTKALDAYNEALRLNSRYPLPWRGKGKIYQSDPELAAWPESSARCFRRYLILLQGGSHPHHLRNKGFRPETLRLADCPLFTWRWLEQQQSLPHQLKDLRQLRDEVLSAILPGLSALEFLQNNPAPGADRDLALLSVCLGDPIGAVALMQKLHKPDPLDLEVEFWLLDQLEECLCMDERAQLLPSATEHARQALTRDIPDSQKFATGLILAHAEEWAVAAVSFSRCTGDLKQAADIWEWYCIKQSGDAQKADDLASTILSRQEDIIQQGGRSILELAPPRLDQVPVKDRISAGDLTAQLVNNALLKLSLDPIFEFLDDTKTLSRIFAKGSALEATPEQRSAGRLARRLLNFDSLSARTLAYQRLSASHADVAAWTHEKSRECAHRLLQTGKVRSMLSLVWASGNISDARNLVDDLAGFIQRHRELENEEMASALKDLVDYLTLEGRLSFNDRTLLLAYLSYRVVLGTNVMGAIETGAQWSSALGPVVAIPARTYLSSEIPEVPGIAEFISAILAATPLLCRHFINKMHEKYEPHIFRGYREFCDTIDLLMRDHELDRVPTFGVPFRDRY